ncbi:MAG: hypothetical protein SNJ82_11335 [Gemmataceae bacterium]
MAKQLFGTLALLVLITLASAEERPAYTIKVRAYPGEGKSFRVQSTDVLHSTLTTEEPGQPAKTVKEVTTRTEDYTQKTLRLNEGKLSTFQRNYASSVVDDGNEKTKTALEGKSVVLTLGKMGCTYDLKEKLPPEEARKLSDAHTDGLAMVVKLLPDKPVREGDEWPLSGKQIVTGMVAIPVDPERSRGKGKLVKVEKKGDITLGTLEFTLEIETIAGANGSGNGKFVLQAETAIDGSSTQAKFQIKGELTLVAEEKDPKEPTKLKKFTAVANGAFTAEISEEK